MNLAWKIGVLLTVVGLAAWLSSDGRGDSGAAQPSGGTVPLQPIFPAEPLPLPRQQVLFSGASWQIHRSKDAVEEARTVLGVIAGLGADTVLIGNAGYQEHAASETFQIDPGVTPSAEQWKEIIAIAHGKGLRVILMPIILLSDPRGNEWRGVINPPSWDDWFDRYRQFLLHFARIAEDNKVEVLSVGSELVSTERYTEQWRGVVAAAREVFHGQLTYSANWDHYKVVEFWDDLDLVGMTSYYKLSEDPSPSLQTLVESWKPIQRGLLRWQKTIGKPLLFTEVGWASQEGASIEPWNYYRQKTATPAGIEEQLRCYQAFMDTWGPLLEEQDPAQPVVGGVIWWEFSGSAGGLEDFGYTPRGKPSERELRDWFERMRGLRRRYEATLKASPGGTSGE